MFESDAALAKRYGPSRPGLQLIAVTDAALPVTQLKVDALAQERKPLPLLDEFTIRLAAMGIKDPQQMARILGVELKLSESSVVDQLAADHLFRVPGRGTLVELTPQGRIMAVELEATRPVQRALPVTFDRLTWEVTSYPPEVLIQRAEAEKAGLIVLPATYRKRIVASDVTIASLNKLLTEGESREAKLDVLAVEGVSPKKHRYLPVKLLIFADDRRAEVQLGLVIEGQLSSSHERALIAAGGHGALGINVGEPAERPALPDDLGLVVASRSSRRDGGTAGAGDDGPVSYAQADPAELEVRDISVHEHPELLRDALSDSRARLVIIAPWIRSSVVDVSFIRSLERLLRRKVKVHVAYGIGKDDHGSDEDALSRLKNLSDRFSEYFVFARLRNSHAKILISDGVWVSTSFNWMSFRGDPSRTYRMEEGILIQSKALVDEAYEKYLRMIDEQRI